MAISLTFRSPERTLTADEIQAAADHIKAALREKLSVDFRE
jgi:phenylalanyl-tRNA synthetase beta subunit